MTCIVGIVDKLRGNVVIGADSAGVSGYDITPRKDAKVFEVGEIKEFLIGCTSSFRMIQLLRFSFNPPRVREKEIYEYMCTDFVTAVRDCFKDGGFMQKYSDGDDKGGSFLVGYQDRLFNIDSDFQVGESIYGADAVGCGAPYALGACYASDHITNKEDVVIKALESAEKFSAGVCRPFNLLCTTETKQLRL